MQECVVRARQAHRFIIEFTMVFENATFLNALNLAFFRHIKYWA